MNNHSDSKWMVSIADEAFSSNIAKGSSLINLKDPSTNESREYIQLANNDLAEIQSLEADFSAFFVGRHIVKDGNLYVMNRVDPLFWVFSHYPPTEQSKQWQPTKQVVDCLPREVQKALNTDQLGHLFKVLNSEEMGDTPFYKFAPERARKWLKKKHARVLDTLTKQERAQQERNKKKFSQMSNGRGAVSDSFYMPDDPVISEPQTPADNGGLSDSELQQLKLESALVISSYLPGDWSEAFLDSLGLKEVQIKATQTKAIEKKPLVSPASSPAQTEQVAAVKPKKKVIGGQTIGNKRLAKISTKGMKSLSSFFGPPKKKSKTQ